MAKRDRGDPSLASIPNYQSAVAETLATAFVSPLVPAADEEAGKAQLLFAAAWDIHQTNPHIGLVAKETGNQILGYTVDVLMDQTDGSAADCVSSTPDAPGYLRITTPWSVYPPNSDPMWLGKWRAPTAELAAWPGPLVPVSVPVPPEPPDPGPDDGRPDGYPDDAPWPPPPILPTWATDGTDLYSLDWYAQMSGNVETIYLNLLWRWSDFRGAANWLHNIREDQMSPAAMTDAIMQSDEYLALHSDA